MGVYLARYQALDRFGLGRREKDLLSAKAGFLKQFKTGDVVLRQMDAADSQALTKITESNYSHSGIIQVKDGRVWVLDSYPGRKDKQGGGDGALQPEDSSTTTRFEEFFGDQHKEKIVQGLALRVEGLSDETRKKIDALIDYYHVAPTQFDRDFRIDNGEFVLYCSELVYRILEKAGSPRLPPNEFAKTMTHAKELSNQLQGLITAQQALGNNTRELELQLGDLEALIKKGATAQPELYSPGSLERAAGFRTLTGFTRGVEITGNFEVIAASATLPGDRWDTPDPFVKAPGGLFGADRKTSAKQDTTKPVWNEPVATLAYSQLRDVTLEIWDEDVVADDLLATFSANLQPVRPKGQTFSLGSAGATLKVEVKEDEEALETRQAPRDHAT